MSDSSISSFALDTCLSNNPNRSSILSNKSPEKAKRFFDSVQADLEELNDED